MSIQNQLTLQIEPQIQEPKALSETCPVNQCQIQIQAANGWAVTGHYQNNILQTLTLRKTAPLEAK